MTIKDLKNKKVTVMGLGRLGGGVGVVNFLIANGAQIIVTDIKKREELEQSLGMIKKVSSIELVLGQHRKEDFIERDFIVKNPGVARTSPYLTIAREHNVPIETDISLFFKLSPARIIGVTGTKGKSTTATLIHRLLSKSYTTFLAGNIGLTPLDFLTKLDTNSLMVLELSSWQLEDMAPFEISPFASIVLNIYPDHLNRHSNFSDYIEAKKNIVRFGSKEGVAIFNHDDPHVQNFSSETKQRVYYFSLTNKVNGAFVKNDHIVFGQEEADIIPVSEIALKGEHNLVNVLGAVTLAKVYKIANKDIRSVLKEFQGVAFRQELIREVKGILFYNDTTATIPEATISALKRFKKNIILIAGGADKKLVYTQLVQEMRQHVKVLILLPGDASDKMEREIGEQGLALKINKMGSMNEAVNKAFSGAVLGDIVILSPAATSFSTFANEFDRGEQFNSAVRAL